jgi:hypothetical protein
MKTKVTINGIEYNLDLEKAKELCILEEKDTRCKSWDEFCEKYSTKEGYFHDDLLKHILYESVRPSKTLTTTSTQFTKEEAIAISAFSKLLKLRRDWIGDWEPDWIRNIEKYCIVCESNLIDIMLGGYIIHPFSFPTKKMAKDFLKCFKDLFNQCKNLI